MRIYRQIGNIQSPDILPFWVVFEGGITRDPKRVREIKFWYDVYQDNYLMWRPGETAALLVQHFNEKLKKYLD